MEHETIEDVETFSHPAGGTDGGRSLTAALGTEHVALNHYTLAPGEAPDGGYHTHLDQEEVFYVTEGTLEFETDEGTVTVEGGEVIRFAPGDYHHAENVGDDTARVLAVGAPGSRHDWEQIRVPVPCPECEDVDAMGVEMGGDGGGALRCPECGETMGV